MNRKIEEAIRQYHMLQQGGSLLAGVSGGADSVALLHFLHQNRQQWGIRLTALHLNHRLRGEESDRDEAFVRELCARWEIPLTVESRPVGQLARRDGLSVEECARRERYAFFARCARREENARISTAHTLTDSVETVLLNLTRGTGLRGLCGIPPVRDNIVRPLILCTRAQVEAYCARHGLSYVEDSTNACDDYSRNKLRHHVLPVLREINPAAEQAAGAAIDRLREDEAYLDARAKEAAEAAARGDGLDTSRLLALPAPIRRRVLIRLLREREIPYGRERLEMLERLAREGGVLQLDSRWLCRCGDGLLTLCRPEEEQGYFEREIAPERLKEGEPVRFPLFDGKTVQLLWTDYENFEESKKDFQKPLKNALDCDRIYGIVRFRQRMPGDSLRPAGRGCTKTLRKLFNEGKYSAGERSRAAVLVGEDGRLLWAEHFGPDETCAVRRGETRRVLLISIVEDSSCERT